MKLRFFEPPPAQKAGGLQAAIDSLRDALAALGHDVQINAGTPLRGSCDAVHFHGIWQRNYPALSRECGAAGIPFVVSTHGMLEPWARRKKWWKKWPYFQLVEKRWMRRAACLLATSEGESRRLRGDFPDSRVECLPLGLTAAARPDYARARESLGWTSEETVLLFLSRIHEKKGLDLLLAALAESHGAWPRETRLVIVGPEEQPDYAARCRAFVARNAARLPRIEWRGAVWGAERWPLFQGADLFCLPTHSENFGLAVLEACQVGTPVLTTTETPWADALHGERGFIARPEVAGIAEQLRRFFSEAPGTSASRQALSNWAWGNFDWSILGPRYASLYADLAHSRPR